MGSLLKWLQKPGLRQAEARARSFILVSMSVAGVQILASACSAFLGALARSWIRTDQDLNCAPVWDNSGFTCCATPLVPCFNLPGPVPDLSPRKASPGSCLLDFSSSPSPPQPGRWQAAISSLSVTWLHVSDKSKRRMDLTPPQPRQGARILPFAFPALLPPSVPCYVLL